MGGVPRPILALVAVGLLAAAAIGFGLGFTQSDRRATASDQQPIAANLPSNVVIKDAQPLAPPPPPPPPKPKIAASDEEPDDSDEAPSPTAPPARSAVRQAAPPAEGPAPLPPQPPPPPPPPASAPGAPLPNDLPPT